MKDKLLVAEKPSVARDLARVLGARRRGNGCFRGGGWVVTWCIGHLVELVEPHEYDPEWKRWSFSTLPLLPERFKLRIVKATRDQYRVVEALLRDASFSFVVNGCDAGREGELIFRYVYELVGSSLPVKRLWVSSMTDDALRQGLANLRPGHDFERLFDAARCRSEADWLVGLNATRAVTVRSRAGRPFSPKAPVYSVGRVQTPTLALITAREAEIRAFVPEDYWLLDAVFEADAGSYTGRWFRSSASDGSAPEQAPSADAPAAAETQTPSNRFPSLAEARVIEDKIRSRKGKVVSVEGKRVHERPPLLFDLTRLQRTANKRYGFSADRTLRTAQKLYEKDKLITYPRTDSTHLSRDMVPTLDHVIKALDVDEYTQFVKYIRSLPSLPISKRFVDDRKVSDHHAIIPTPRRPSLERLDPDAGRIYDLIVRRFLGIFFPDAEIEHTRIVTEVEGETFLTKGRVIAVRGWRDVAGFDDASGRSGGRRRSRAEEEGDDEDQGVVPPLKVDDPAVVVATEILEKKTRPPPRYTEAALLAAMEGAGRLIEDEEFQQAMKDRGLGTPATRASIIETLIRRRYIVRKGKRLEPTERGMNLIAAIPVESLKSPRLTGEWESRLASMARGEYPSAEFMEEIRDYVRDIVARVRTSSPIAAADDGPVEGARPAGSSRKAGKGRASGPSGARGRRGGAGKLKDSSLGHEDVPCPRCGGGIVFDPKGAHCVDGNHCRFVVNRVVAGKKLRDSTLAILLRKGKTRTLKGFVSPHSGIVFSAALILKDGGGIAFDFKDVPGRDGKTAGTPEAAGRPGAERGGRDGGKDAGLVESTGRCSPRKGHGGQRSCPRGALGKAAPADDRSPGRAALSCPQCGRGTMIRGRAAWGCSQWRASCRFVVPYEIAGYRLGIADLRTLIETSRLPSSSSGRPALVLLRDTQSGVLRVEREEKRESSGRT